MIRAAVTLTAQPFSSAPPTIPTIDVHDDERAPEAHRRAMSTAHILAAWLWSTNDAGKHLMGRPISVETVGEAHARVIVETFTNAAEERDAVLGLMREAVARVATATKPSRDGVAFRPDGRQIRVSIPGRD